MLVVFVDTSAFFALQAEDDTRHAVATRRFQYLISNKIPLVTTNYVAVETCAQFQRQFGMAALRTFRNDDCGCKQAFAFDAHFEEEGFDCEIPISPAN